MHCFQRPSTTPVTPFIIILHCKPVSKPGLTAQEVHLYNSTATNNSV